MARVRAFDAFSEDVRHIHTSWIVWRQLFDRAVTSREQPEQLTAAMDRAYRVTSSASAMVFEYIRWHMLKGVLVDVARLCDRTEMHGGENLTVERVLEDSRLVPGAIVPVERASAVMQEVLEFARSGTGLRGLRNKTLVHNDLNTALETCEIADVDIEATHSAIRNLVHFRDLIARAWAPEGSPERTSITPTPQSEIDAWKREADRVLDVLEAGLESERLSS
jgi:hypothetical protein